MLVTCYAQATHRYIYSFFPAFRAPSFLTNIPIYTHIIPTAHSGLDNANVLIGGNLLNELINDAKAVYGVVTTIIAVLA
jgi:hypothetical protein